MYDGLIRQYLHVEPADDMGLFAEQAGQALALEERFLKALAASVANAVARAMGGK